MVKAGVGDSAIRNFANPGVYTVFRTVLLTLL